MRRIFERAKEYSECVGGFCHVSPRNHADAGWRFEAALWPAVGTCSTALCLTKPRHGLSVMRRECLRNEVPM